MELIWTVLLVLLLFVILVGIAVFWVQAGIRPAKKPAVDHGQSGQFRKNNFETSEEIVSMSVKDFSFSPPKSVPVTTPVIPELPAGYGDNKIVTLVRDPYWLFCYWEISPEKQGELRNSFGQEFLEKLFLRVYDITGVAHFDGTNAVSFFDIPVHGLIHSWCINVNYPNHTYCVELGIKTKNGWFIPITRSNFVTTPRDTYSDVIDEDWLAIDELDSLFRRRKIPAEVLSSPEFLQPKIRKD